ncbi:transposase [Rhodococcus ruber]|uniref:Transposase n=1 Tax=Rhodococcus ruber TaxID=1830 RepID=A0ABT4MC51_9NOCA|nr:transposase [Rhodococcus ruber]MCZ4518095.1 transposase [Rhodococcus ruber]
MTHSGIVEADHHQFVVGSPSAETYEPAATGSVMEVGRNFVTVMTGVAYGPVSVTVELLTTAPGGPGAEVEWEVIEEATIKVSKPFRVITLDGEVAQDFPVLSIVKGLNTFRVSARGRDVSPDQTVTAPTESYLVQVWKVTQPAALRRLHKTDTVWNDDITVHKVRSWWDPDPAADATLYIKYGYEYMTNQVKQDAIDWGGRPPTDKLYRAHYSKQFAFHDRMLVDALARARAPKLRTIAAWAVRRSYTLAGVADIDWIRAGLEALENETPLPAPFDDRHSTKVWDAFNAESRIQMWVTSDSGEQVPTAAVAAAGALTKASGVEPFAALFDVLKTLLVVQHQVDHPDQVPFQRPDYDHVGLISDVRREFFPKLAPADRYERWIGHTVDDVLRADTGQ